MVFRLDAVTGGIIARRTAPGRLRVDTIGGLARIDERLFLLDRPSGTLLELDVDDFTEVPDPDRPAPTTDLVSPDAADVTAAVQSIFSSGTDPDDMAALIADGAELSEPIAAFRQFFADQFPGETVGAEVYGVRFTGDEAEVDYAVTVSGAPIIEIRTAHLDRVDGAWLLRRADFCDLVALGGIDCPP